MFKIYNVNSNHYKAGITLLISDKAGLRARKFNRDKRDIKL